MREMVSGCSLVGLHIKTISMILEDWEREHLKDVVYLQADKLRTEEEIMQEMIEEENRLPANITVVYPKTFKPDDIKDNALPF
jgi:hypothetical protein